MAAKFDHSKLLDQRPTICRHLLIDYMSQTEEGPGTDAIKAPYGVINYSINGYSQTDVTWKMTGNLGGEQYHDLTRGPRNEGAMYAERQGYHLPDPPDTNWTVSSPMPTWAEREGAY